MTESAPTRAAEASCDGAFPPMRPPPRLLVPCLTYTADAPVGWLKMRPAGTVVKAGDELVEPHPSLRCTPLAPAAGTIVSLGRAAVVRGREVPAVILETSPIPSPAADAPNPPPVDFVRGLGEAGFVEWIDRLRASALWAPRWACPDPIEQLHRCLKRPVDTVICSVLDLDATLPVQAMVAASWPAEVVAAVRALASLTGAGRSWLAAPDNLPEACAAKLRSAVQDTDVRLVPVENRYPMAHPSLLVDALTGRLVRFGNLPVDQGVLMLDAAAAWQAGRLFLRNARTLALPMGIFDQSTRRARFVMAPIGTSIEYLLEQIGVAAQSAIISSGTPLHEQVLTPDCVVSGAGLTIYASPPIREASPEPCIRCGWCIEACPVHIQPAALLEAAQRGDAKLAQSCGLPACIECGICTYVCASNLPLLQGIRSLRKTTPAQ